MKKCKIGILIKLQMRMIFKEKVLWIFMLVYFISFAIIKAYDCQLFKNDGLNTLFENISYSIIAAFVFYVLTVFYPRSMTDLKMYHNIYMSVYRIDDLMSPIFSCFIDDTNSFRDFPEKFVKKFVVKKDKEHDKYTVDSFIAGQLIFIIPKISNMIISLRYKYSDYLKTEHLTSLDVLEDANQIIKVDIIRKEMSYKEVEALFLQLVSFYATIRTLVNEYKQYD